jgi:hypothetical protein
MPRRRACRRPATPRDVPDVIGREKEKGWIVRKGRARTGGAGIGAGAWILDAMAWMPISSIRLRLVSMRCWRSSSKSFIVIVLDTRGARHDTDQVALGNCDVIKSQNRGRQKTDRKWARKTRM